MYYNVGMTEQELLKKCVEKDRDAWDIFLRRYRGVVTRSVRYKLKRMGMRHSKGEAMDIVQDIFLRLWEKDRLAGVKRSECLEGWLAMVSINSTANYCRKHAFTAQAKALSLEDELFGGSGPRLGDVIPSHKLDNGKAIESAEIKEAIDKEIAKLGARQQLVLKFNIYEGKTPKDIAEIMNIPHGTASVFLKRAKDRVRERLKKVLGVEKV